TPFPYKICSLLKVPNLSLAVQYSNCNLNQINTIISKRYHLFEPTCGLKLHVDYGKFKTTGIAFSPYSLAAFCKSKPSIK
ncbi:hypothetical protein N9D61_08470, partial [Planktomarina sp.]|nr:hypothetical protein [Planktomarina sp.]